MNVETLLEELIQNNVKLSVQEDKLLCQLPENGIDGKLLDRLKSHKEEIKGILQKAKRPGKKPSILKRLHDSSPRPLSYAQQRLWILDRIEGSAHYNISNALLLEGNLNFELFQKAFNVILERHEILRTTYDLAENGSVSQIIQPVAPLAITKVDLSAFTEEEQRNKVKQVQFEESKLSFDLAKDTLLRVKLIQTKADAFVVLVTMHHIATDGWSIGILIKEFSALYSAFAKGEANPLSDLEIQYADYAGWQQEWLKGEPLEQLKNYWSDQLQNLPPVHSIPLDYSRPQVQTFKGNTLSSKIAAETLNDLKKICDQEGATLFAGLYTAFSVLLGRYSNESDVVVGTPIANREQSQVENLIGFFVNMLVLRNQLPENASFLELIRQSRQVLFDAYAHQQMPFDKLVSTLQSERNPGYSSLFQIMFVLQNNEKAEIKLHELSLRRMEQSKPFAMYDLSLLIDQQADGLHLNWEYNTDIFNLSTIERMSGHFERLLKSLVQSPEKEVSTAGMMSAEEMKQVLRDFNQTEQFYPQDQTVIDLFEAQVLKTPDAIALTFEDRSYTYREFNAKANQIAGFLIEKYAVGCSDKIGVMLNRSFESVVAMIGIMKSGACYVPIDYKLPLSTIDHMIRDTELQLVLTRRGLYDIGNKKEIDFVFIDESDLIPYSADNPEVSIAIDRESYVIYTSGSTGKPKGVIQTHRMLSNLIRWNTSRGGIETGLRFLQYASFYFDVSLQDSWLSLCTGGTLYVANENIRTDFKGLLKYIIRNSIEVLVFPFSAMNILFFSNGLSDFEGHTIKHIIASGEQLVVNASLQEFLTYNKDVKLHNHYGPSETHVVTAYTMQTGNRYHLKSLPIGKPIDNTRIYILDRYLKPVPIGVKGEIYIEGANLALGYLNLPELTTARFITSPLNAAEKLYKTGDIAYWTADGNIIYADRNDNQIKIRGYRIEPQEIERALEELPQIVNAVIQQFEQAEGKSLCAYLVSDQEIDIQEIRAHLQNKVPEYMIPSYFVRIAGIPLTSNGKIDKRALPNPLTHGLRILHEYVAPESETEIKLCAIWEDILDRKMISINESFFELGGDSIKAINLLNRVQKQYNLQVTVVDFFTRPTVKLLSEEIDTALMLKKQQTKKETKAIKI